MKLAMINAADVVLKYKKQKPEADVEEIIKHVMKSLKVKGKSKIYSIAAANYALKYKEKKPWVKDKEIMQKIMNESGEIIKSIENSEKEK